MSNLITLTIVFGIAFICYFLKIRICPFFNLFKIPCPGCGLTRSIKCILEGQIIKSIQYNPFGLIFTTLILIYLIYLIFGKKEKWNSLLKKHEKMLIIIFAILTIIIWIINIKNPLLY